MQKILKYIRKADEDYSLIEPNDKIAIGVSGGKDSMLLLKALKQYQHFDHKAFTFVAIHLKMGFPSMDSSIIKAYCEQEQIEYYEEDAPIYEILKHYKKNDNTLNCSRCSNLKRGAIIGAAQTYNCNKVAFAHHQDDAIETLFLNAIYGGKLSIFQPKIAYDDSHISFIRPLIYVSEKEIIRVVKQEQLPIVKSTCPQDGNSKREDIKQLLDTIYKKYPQAQKNLLHLLSNDSIHLWKKIK